MQSLNYLRRIYLNFRWLTNPLAEVDMAARKCTIATRVGMELQSQLLEIRLRVSRDQSSQNKKENTKTIDDVTNLLNSITPQINQLVEMSMKLSLLRDRLQRNRWMSHRTFLSVFK